MYQNVKRTCRVIVFSSLNLLFCGIVVAIVVVVKGDGAISNDDFSPNTVSILSACYTGRFLAQHVYAKSVDNRHVTRDREEARGTLTFW